MTDTTSDTPDTTTTSDTEIWADIPGTSGRYRISTRGRVRGPRGGLLKVQVNRSGYRSVCVLDTPAQGGKLRTCYIGRAMLRAFVSEPPVLDGRPARACYLDHDPSNTTLTNLAWMSVTESNRQKQATGHFGPCCPHGHPYLELDGPNVVATRARRGHVDCLACRRARGWLAKHPELQGPDGAVPDEVFQRISDDYWTRAVFGEFNSGNARTATAALDGR